MAVLVGNICGFEPQGNEEAVSVAGTVNADETTIFRSGASSLHIPSNASANTNRWTIAPTETGGPSDQGVGNIYGFAFYFDAAVTTTREIFRAEASGIISASVGGDM